MSAYIAADTPLDPAKFNSQSVAVESATPKVDASASRLSSIAIKSTPDGAEITVDNKFVGTTPSTIQLAPGDHKIGLAKSGFKSWDRTITVTAGGTLNLDANLDKVP